MATANDKSLVDLIMAWIEEKVNPEDRDQRLNIANDFLDEIQSIKGNTDQEVRDKFEKLFNKKQYKSISNEIKNKINNDLLIKELNETKETLKILYNKKWAGWVSAPLRTLKRSDSSNSDILSRFDPLPPAPNIETTPPPPPPVLSNQRDVADLLTNAQELSSTASEDAIPSAVSEDLTPQDAANVKKGMHIMSSWSFLRDARTRLERVFGVGDEGTRQRDEQVRATYNRLMIAIKEVKKEKGNSFTTMEKSDFMNNGRLRGGLTEEEVKLYFELKDGTLKLDIAKYSNEEALHTDIKSTMNRLKLQDDKISSLENDLRQIIEANTQEKLKVALERFYKNGTKLEMIPVSKEADTSTLKGKIKTYTGYHGVNWAFTSLYNRYAREFVKSLHYLDEHMRVSEYRGAGTRTAMFLTRSLTLLLVGITGAIIGGVLRLAAFALPFLPPLILAGIAVAGGPPLVTALAGLAITSVLASTGYLAIKNLAKLLGNIATWVYKNTPMIGLNPRIEKQVNGMWKNVQLTLALEYMGKNMEYNDEKDKPDNERDENLIKNLKEEMKTLQKKALNPKAEAMLKRELQADEKFGKFIKESKMGKYFGSPSPRAEKVDQILGAPAKFAYKHTAKPMVEAFKAKSTAKSNKQSLNELPVGLDAEDLLDNKSTKKESFSESENKSEADIQPSSDAKNPKLS